jgi:hypothetical protein
MEGQQNVEAQHDDKAMGFIIWRETLDRPQGIMEHAQRVEAPGGLHFCANLPLEFLFISHGGET